MEGAKYCGTSADNCGKAGPNLSSRTLQLMSEKKTPLEELERDLIIVLVKARLEKLAEILLNARITALESMKDLWHNKYGKVSQQLFAAEFSVSLASDEAKKLDAILAESSVQKEN